MPARKDKGPEPSGFVFPGPDDRVTIVGMTGSGKSTFAMWLFTECADFNKKPWIFIDYKRESLISQALEEDMIKRIKLSSDIPKSPGIYVVHPELDDGPDPVNEFLRKIYKRGKVGVIVDETTMIPNTRGDGNTGGPYQTLLSQGRSKEIPVWSLSQRPAFINKMAFTENNYFCAFRLKSEDDNDKVLREIPSTSKNYKAVWANENFPKGHQSRWYDANEDVNFPLRPCPPPDDILNKLFDRVDNLKKRASI